jgi:8-oxo-dGTP diphosphatase
MSEDRPPDDTPKVTRVAAYALVEDRDGRLLLCRMAPGQPAAGKWTLPGGGLHFGEAPETGVLRELAEETCLEGRILEIVGVTNRALRISKPSGDHHVHAVGICYRVLVTGGTLRDELAGSTDRTGWFTRAEMADLPVTHLVTSALEFLARG